MEKTIPRNALLGEIDAMSDEIHEISLWMYNNPELPRQEYRSAEYLTKYLEKNGFHVEKNIAGLETAFIARFNYGQGGPRIGFLAEYDALPGVGHGCGHNLIAASCVGAAVALSRVVRSPAEIIVYGTPDEEYDGGKIIMSQEGVFAGLDMAIQVHASASENYVGGSSTPHQTMVVGFKGKAAHTAFNPSEGVNALNAVLITFVGLHAMQQNLKPGTRIPATITHGGGAPNAMPEFAQFRIHVTTLEADYLQVVVDKIKNCARAGALATGAEVDIWEGPVYKKLISNRLLTGILERNFVSLGLKTVNPPPAMAATDVGNVSWDCPTVMAHISLGAEGVPMHSVEFAECTVGEKGRKATLDAAKSMACTALEIIENPEILEAVKAEYKATFAKGE